MRDELAVLLAGLIIIVLCAGCSIVPTSTEVRVPVPIACIESPPAATHRFSPAELKAMDDYHLALALAYNSVQLELYVAALEAAIAGCWQPNPQDH